MSEEESSMNSSPFISITDWQPYFIALAIYMFIGAILWSIRSKTIQVWHGIGIVALVLGVILRLVAATKLASFPYDFATFYAWSEGLVQYGFGAFYVSQRFIDYPPGYMYVLYLVGEIRHGFGFIQGSVGSAILLKAPAIVADIGISLVLYRISREVGRNRLGIFIATLFMLNPVVWLNSALWGQVDSVFTLILLLAVWQLSKKAYTNAGIWYAIAILIKPQALLFGPVFLFVPLRSNPIQAWRNMVLSGLVTFIIGITPFALHQEPQWIYNLYKSTLSSYAYYSVNAFNVPALLGGNWQPLSDSASLFSTLTLGLIVIAAGLYAWYYRHTPKLEGYLALWVILSVFLFAFKMHERYLFPALALILLIWLWTKEVRWAVVFTLVTLAQMINVGLIYIQSLGHNQPLLFGQVAINTSAILLLIAWGMTTWFALRKEGGYPRE
jgi:dolichyl-phosphate-mannose-protein mannosyltransferase